MAMLNIGAHRLSDIRDFINKADFGGSMLALSEHHFVGVLNAHRSRSPLSRAPRAASPAVIKSFFATDVNRRYRRVTPTQMNR